MVWVPKGTKQNRRDAKEYHCHYGENFFNKHWQFISLWCQANIVLGSVTGLAIVLRELGHFPSRFQCLTFILNVLVPDYWIYFCCAKNLEGKRQFIHIYFASIFPVCVWSCFPQNNPSLWPEILFWTPCLVLSWSALAVTDVEMQMLLPADWIFWQRFWTNICILSWVRDFRLSVSDCCKHHPGLWRKTLVVDCTGVPTLTVSCWMSLSVVFQKKTCLHPVSETWRGWQTTLWHELKRGVTHFMKQRWIW